MKKIFPLTDIAAFTCGCSFTLESLNEAIQELETTMNISSKEFNRRLREGLVGFWLKHIYEIYVDRKGCEVASKGNYLDTYVKSGFSPATYKAYESKSRVNEIINKGNLYVLINAFCRFSNEFQHRKDSPLDCLMLIIDGPTRRELQQVPSSDFPATALARPILKYIFIAVAFLSIAIIGLAYLVIDLSFNQKAVLPFKKVTMEYVNHATDQVKLEKLQIKYPTKNSVYKNDSSLVKLPFGGHASFKEESIRINWVLIKCESDCAIEYAQKGGAQQLFGSTQTHSVAVPPKNNWHVDEVTLFSGRSIFIASATYSTGIKRIESLILEPQ